MKLDIVATLTKWCRLVLVLFVVCNSSGLLPSKDGGGCLLLLLWLLLLLRTTSTSSAGRWRVAGAITRLTAAMSASQAAILRDVGRVGAVVPLVEL